MVQIISEVMTPEPVAMDASTSLADAARVMRDCGIGDVIVIDGSRLCGIVTDRDIVIRAVASHVHPDEVSIGQICSRDVSYVEPTATIGDALEMMRQRALRRIPVVHNGRPVGIVCLGDLAIERDPRSALAGITLAQSNT